MATFYFFFRFSPYYRHFWHLYLIISYLFLLIPVTVKKEGQRGQVTLTLTLFRTNIRCKDTLFRTNVQILGHTFFDNTPKNALVTMLCNEGG